MVVGVEGRKEHNEGCLAFTGHDEEESLAIKCGKHTRSSSELGLKLYKKENGRGKEIENEGIF